MRPWCSSSSSSPYIDVFTKTGGSLSIWATEDDLRRFVALPRHVAIMRRYRDRVRVRRDDLDDRELQRGGAWEQRNERLAAAGAPGASSKINRPKGP
jgi:hypothetical protein